MSKRARSYVRTDCGEVKELKILLSAGEVFSHPPLDGWPLSTNLRCMADYATERRRLQIAVGAAAGVPAGVGLWGVLAGLGAPGSFADSHYRYLSGVLVGIAVAYWSLLPRIERAGWPFRILTLIIVIGGLARLGALFASGGSPSIWGALAMELGVAPILMWWRERVERMDPGEPPRYARPWG